jgi:hypothetical protein
VTAETLRALQEILLALGVALLVTTLSEVVVGAAFGVGSKGLLAILCVNLVTNPALNIALRVLGSAEGALVYLDPWLPYLLALEVTVVLVEWRLLVWVFRGTRGTAPRLLGLSASMNAASLVFGAMASQLLYRVLYYP